MVMPPGKGHAFLPGDAAHVHNLVGGQGRNTGIEEPEELLRGRAEWPAVRTGAGAASA